MNSELRSAPSFGIGLILGWIRRLVRWFVAPRMLWLFVISLFVTHGLARIISAKPDVRVAAWGMLLQLLGVSVVYWGIRGRRIKFSLPSLWQRIQDWLKAFPATLHDHHSCIVGSGHMSLRPHRVSAVGTVNPPPESSVDEQLGLLWDRLNELHKDQARLRTDFLEQNERNQNLLGALEHVQATRMKQLNVEMREMATDSLELEFLGVLWLAIGVALASIPSLLEWLVLF